MNKTLQTILITAAVMVLPTAVNSQIPFSKYCNARFSYCLTYPAFLVPQGEATNGDGQKFLAEDKQSELIAWGANNIYHQSVQAAYDDYMAGKIVVYKVIEKNAFVASGYDKGKVFYQKIILENGLLKGFYLSYPLSQRKIFDRALPGITLGKN